LYLGNMDALRDWGNAKDYVHMQWMMLQQDKPVDYVIAATGKQYSVREFVQWSAHEVGVTIRFEGIGIEETGIVDSVSPDSDITLTPGDVIVRVDPRYFRPAEVETLLGDPSKAKADMGWVPEITAEAMCREMVKVDLRQSTQDATAQEARL